MHTAGLIIALFGALFLFASALALSCIPNKNENSKFTIPEVLDLIMHSGIINALRSLLRSIMEGLKNRSSPLFPAVVLFGLSIGLLLLGFGLMSFS